MDVILDDGREKLRFLDCVKVSVITQVGKVMAVPPTQVKRRSTQQWSCCSSSFCMMWNKHGHLHHPSWLWWGPSITTQPRWHPLRCGSSRLDCDWVTSGVGVGGGAEKLPNRAEKNCTPARNRATLESMETGIINLGRRAPPENLVHTPSKWGRAASSGVDRTGLQASAAAEEEGCLDAGQSLPQRNYSPSSIEDGPRASEKRGGRQENLSADAETAQISNLMFSHPWARQQDQQEPSRRLACLCLWRVFFHYLRPHSRVTFTWWRKQVKVNHPGRDNPILNPYNLVVHHLV